MLAPRVPTISTLQSLKPLRFIQGNIKHHRPPNDLILSGTYPHDLCRCRFKDTRISIDRPTPRAQPAAPTVAESPLKMMTVADLNAIIDPFDFEVFA